MALFIILFLFTFPFFTFSGTIPTITSPNPKITISGFAKLSLPPNVASTGSITFDLLNGGPYTGTLDGRIFKYNKIIQTFQPFAYTSPNRTKAYCDGTNTYERSQICGFPTGLSTDLSGIYVVDPFIGLTRVGFLGGLATILVPTYNGVPYHILLGVEAAPNHKVYFPDASSVYNQPDVNISVATGDSTGKLFEYDIITKKVTELLSQLGGPRGVATNSDGSVLFVSEFNARRIRKYYIKGPKVGTSEIFLTFSGNPNKIKRINGEDNFWVPVNYQINETFVIPQGVKFSNTGEILATVDFSKEYNKRIAGVYQQGKQLFVVGRNQTYLGRYNLEFTW